MRLLIGLVAGLTLGSAAYADPCCVTQASGFGGGSGTAADPYQVCEAAHLNEVRNNLNSEFIQTADISMAGFNHLPIGSPANPFEGVYDGQGYRIIDLTINNAALGAAGLFGVVGVNGIVRNLTLQVQIAAGDFTGGLAGIHMGLIERCGVIGNVNGGDQVGGLVGQCDAGAIRRCFSTGTVQAQQFAGGLVGFCLDLSAVADSYSHSSAGAMVTDAGGLIGEAFFTSVQRCYSTGAVVAPMAAGGLIGFRAGGGVTDSFWDVMTSGLAVSAGGTGRNTADMLLLANYAPPWNFNNVWTMLDGETYPRLQWEPLAPPPIALQDLDFDGVRDDQDRCPNTIPGAPVGASGCPEPPIPFDSDLDGDVDILDLEALQSCTLGPATAAVPTCAPLNDRNADGFVDLWEHAIFQRCFSGTDVAADAECAGPNLPPHILPIQVELAACTGAPEDPEGPNDAVPGRHFHRLTLNEPRAVCNDGTPAVIYIQAAPAGSPNADRWVIYFQGGGSCRAYDDCKGRWCGINPPFDASKMSSRWAPNTIGGTGLFLPCLPNSVHDYNHVYLPYCSSDNYSGTNGRVVLTDETDPSLHYSLYFNGHFVVEAVLRALESGAVSDDGEVQMPLIQDAVGCITTGSSAGGGGAERHVDWIAERYPSAAHYFVRDAGPAARVSLLSGPVPSNTNCMTGASPYTWEEAAATEEALIQAENETYVIPNWKPFADESCRDLLPEEEHWRCNGGSYVTFNHITTPMFLRHDLRDTVSGSLFLDGVGVCLNDLAVAVRETLLQIANIPTTAVEGASITVVPGAYGPQCGTHEGIYINDLFFISTVEDALGVPVTFHDAVRAWLDGNAVSVVDDPAMPTSVCP